MCGYCRILEEAMTEYDQYRPVAGQNPGVHISEESVDEKVIMGNQGGEPIVDEVHVADFSGFEDINEGRALGMDQPRTLNKHRSVMDFHSSDEIRNKVLYGREGEDSADVLWIDGDVFEQLGRPSQIDVTVRPHQ